MTRRIRMKMVVVGLLCGAIPLFTAVSCDPYRGTFDIYRESGAAYDYYTYDDFFVYEDYYYVDDCWGWCW